MNKKLFPLIAICGFTFLPSLANADEDCWEKCGADYVTCTAKAGADFASCAVECLGEDSCSKKCSSHFNSNNNQCTKKLNKCKDAC